MADIASDVSYLLDETGIVSYLAQLPHIARWLGNGPASWDVEEISEGNVNHVFGVHGTRGSVCVKQAPPYVRAAGDQWPLTPERISFEYKALLEHGLYAARFLPQPLHYDPARKLMIAEYLEGYHVVRGGLTAGNSYINFATEIAEYLAATLFFTSDFGMPSPRKRDLVRTFEANSAMCEIMEDMVFTEILMQHPRNQWTTPWLDTYIEDLQHDSRVKLAISKLKLNYMTCKQALLHGDLHTGSIMTSGTTTRVIDQEFACYGPIAYDIGTLIAHLIISYFARDGHESDNATRESFQSWALGAVETIWREFRSRFLTLWEEVGSGDAYPAKLFNADHECEALAAERVKFMDELLIDSARFCAAEILRRVIGYASVSDFTTLRDESVRATCELRSMVLAKTLLTQDYQDFDITRLTESARRLRRELHP